MRFSSTPAVIETSKKSSGQNNRLEIEQLKQIIRLLGAEIKTARAQSTQKTLASEEIQKKLSFLEIENKRLTEQCSRAQQQASVIHTQQIAVPPSENKETAQQLTSLVLQLSKMQEEIHALILEKTALIRGKQEADETIWKTNHELKSLQGQILSAGQREEFLQKEKTQYQEKADQLQTQLLTLEKELHSEKSAFLLLKKEHSQLEERLSHIIQEKTLAETACIALKQDLQAKTVLLEENNQTITLLENKNRQFSKENEAIEKQRAETDELLVIKLRTIAEIEEEAQTLKENLQATQKEVQEVYNSKEQLEASLKESQKVAHSSHEQLQGTKKELESFKQKLAISVQKLQQLETWKRKIEPSLIQLKTSLEDLSNIEKQSYKEEISFHQQRCDIDEAFIVHKPRLAQHDSLF